MAFQNLGFEDDDPADPGFPENWGKTLNSTAEDTAGFGDGSGLPRPQPFEAFEGDWDSNEGYLFNFADPIDLGEITPAVYDDVSPLVDVEAFEDFEEGWGQNETYIFELASVDPAGFSINDAEEFEANWFSNESFAFDWGDVTSPAAVYDSAISPENFEDFEEGWNSNQSFAYTWPSDTAAVYDSGGTPEAAEDFEEVLAPFVATANPATDRLIKTAHGLSNNQQITLTNSGGVLPAGLSPGYTYFVVNKTANDFQVAATSGGAAIDLTDAGIGTHTVHPDPAVFWTTVMSTL